MLVMFGRVIRVGRPTFDAMLQVDVRRLARWAGKHPGWKGTLRWEPSGSEARYTLLRDFEHGVGLLTVSWATEGRRVVRAPVHLVTTRPRYGGLRWWVLCPGCSRRCAVLAIAAGTHLACRVCLDLAYQSQRQKPHEREIERSKQLRRRHGGPASVLEPWFEKPPRMHWRTWENMCMEDRALRVRVLEGIRERLGRRGVVC